MLNLFHNMQARYKGIILAIIFLVLLSLVSAGEDYIIFRTGNYGQWNECNNKFNYDSPWENYFNEELIEVNCGVKLAWDDLRDKQDKRSSCVRELGTQLSQNRTRDNIELCGVQSEMPLANFRVVVNNFRNFFFAGIFVVFGVPLKAVFLIIISFYIGFYFDKKKKNNS